MSTRRQTLQLAALSTGVALGIVACQPQQTSEPASSASPTSASPTNVFLTGTGATFPMFLYQRWFSEFNRINPHIQINYQATGSGVGIEQMIAETTDFGASDVAMTDQEIGRVKRGVVLIPMTAGSIAVAYNLPGIESGLKLPRAVYPAIFLGEITTWNDPQIVAANPDLTLPDLPIVVVQRADGSGTTAAFTSHLSAISPQWQQEVGTGLNVSWKAGVGVKANAGVAAQIQQQEGAIGYVEYSYADKLNMTTAALENKAGDYVLPNLESTTKALSSVPFPADLRVFVPDPDQPEAYPIVTYSWIMAYQEYDDPNQAKAIRDVLQWSLTEGQKFSEELGYVPLSREAVQKATSAVAQIKP
ncbi:MAG: phosphate ABC transporter substrate-binding protein PstS [Cyanobacteria bacterium RM1_2_2]|nr:phosphate ABC transporter substrate-binding protein PstS [Cyanobacteria bacterium RM1_2_2]